MKYKRTLVICGLLLAAIAGHEYRIAPPGTFAPSGEAHELHFKSSGQAFLTIAYGYQMKECKVYPPQVIRDGIKVLIHVIPKDDLVAAHDDLYQALQEQGHDQFCSILNYVLKKQEPKNIDIFTRMMETLK
jgi:hypothetical protein